MNRKVQLTGEDLLPITQSGAPPSEFKLMPYGVTKSAKGDFFLSPEGAARIVESWRSTGNPLSADFEHGAVVDDISPGTPIPSAAFFELEAREDGLYAVNIKWTPRAFGMLSGREYAFHSPAFWQNEHGEVVEFINFALTNTPAIIGVPSIVPLSRGVTPQGVEKGGNMDLLLKALNNARTEDAGLAEVGRLKEAAATMRVVLSLAGVSSGEELAARIKALSAIEAEHLEFKAQKEAEAKAKYDQLIKEALSTNTIKAEAAADWEALDPEYGSRLLSGLLPTPKATVALSRLPVFSQAAPIPTVPTTATVSVDVSRGEGLVALGRLRQLYGENSVEYQQAVSEVRAKRGVKHAD